MNSRSHLNERIARVCAIAAFVLPAALAGEPRADEGRVGPERCAECHKQEFKAWNASTHARLLTDTEDDAVLDKADEIAEKLGLDDIETSPACVGCHFSAFTDEEGEEQLTSIDCESCHGAAGDWIDLHSDYGSKDGKQIEEASEEDPAHRQKRIAEAKAAGWLHPNDIVAVASNCLACHTGPGQRLVSEGGHPPGSEFELVSRLNGEVRHNFHRTNQKENAPIGSGRARQLYVVGLALDLEYALRGLAEATGPGPYLDAMSARVAAARKGLEAVKGAKALGQVDSMLAAADSVPMKPNQRQKAEAAADTIRAAADGFAAEHDGSALAALDPLIPKKAVGSPFPGR